MKPRIEIVPSVVAEQYFVRVVAANGEIVAVTELFATKSNAWRAARRLPEIVADAEILDVES